MNEQPVNVARISWRDLFPWTIIFKTLPIAVGIPVLVWASMGVVLTPVGWIIGEQIFITDEMRLEDPFLKEFAEINRSPYRSVFRATASETTSPEVLGSLLSGPSLVFENITKPFRALFQANWSPREYLYLFFGAVWALLVWAFAGCAISRVCILRLTRDEPLGLDEAFNFACHKYKDCVGALVMPLAAIAFLCIPLAMFGLLLGFDFGVALAGIFWVFALAASAVIAFLLLGLMFGWPLIVASISAEGQNSFDAVTRSFAYTFQRPLNYVLYIVVAILFGGFCWLIVSNVTNGIVDLSYWSTSWGANRFGVEGYDDSVRRIDVVKGLIDPIPQTDQTPSVEGEPGIASEPPALSPFLNSGRRFIGFWNGIARTLAAAFIHGLFWCMASAIYLLLRKDVDETKMDEVYDVDEKRTYNLPPLKSDQHGVPQAQEPVPVDETAPTDASEVQEQNDRSSTD